MPCMTSLFAFPPLIIENKTMIIIVNVAPSHPWLLTSGSCKETVKRGIRIRPGDPPLTQDATTNEHKVAAHVKNMAVVGTPSLVR